MTVEGFSLWLDGWEDLLASNAAVDEIEHRLLGQLDSSVRLLRWAIVQHEAGKAGSRIRCEGAYLRQPAA